MRSLHFGLGVLFLGLTGCRLSPLSLGGDCDPARQTTGGECCDVWKTPEGPACVSRSWALPGAEDALGEGDVRWINVSVDGLGRPAATWIEADDSVGRVVIAESAGGSFVTRSPAEALGGAAVQSDIATGPDGEAVVAWKLQYPGEEARVFVSEREPDGTWRDPVSDQDSFSFLPTAYEPRPRIFANGDRMVVWNQWMSTGYGVAVATRRAGGDWQLPAGADDVLSQHFFFSNAPQPAINDRGDVVISWYQSDGAALLAWESERRGYDGEFSHPAPGDYLSVRDAPIDSHPIANPKPALSPDGHAAVAWTQENGKGSTLVYMASRDPDGPWQKPQSLDDALSPRLGYARCAQIAFAPTGDLFVVWYQDTGNGYRVYAAHRGPDGTWVEPGREPTVLSTEGLDALYPALAIGPGGGVLVVWTEKRPEGWVTAARRRGPTGAEWGPVETLSEGSDASTEPAVAIGGSGDVAVVGWVQSDGVGDRGYFARLP